MAMCPSADQLRQYVDECLDAAAAATLSRHLDECATCQDVLEELTRAPATPAERNGFLPAEVRERLLARPPALADTLNRGPTSEEDRPAPQVPGYEILGELGRGGMGVVYQARQVSLNRLVALKVILAGAHADPQHLHRFRAEAEAVARLRHPNFVQVYDHGTSDGCPYLALEYVEGGTLAQKTAGVPQPPAQAAQTVATLATAMHYAHRAGLVHRDLKPANVLLTADGVLKITDFGLVKRLHGEPGASAPGERTRTGALLGTPTYMAPEQVTGEPAVIGPATDVYALGVLLYELATGRPPFQAGSVLEVLRQVKEEEPVPPSRLRSSVPRDLETICLKCLRKEPGQRYASAVALAEDLQHFQAGEPIAARPAGTLERSWRWCRRKPVVAGLTAALALLLVTGTLVSTALAVVATRAKQDALAAAAAETRAKEMAEARETETRAVLKFVEDKILAAARPEGQVGGLGRAVTLRKAIEEALPYVDQSFADEPLIEARLRMTLGRSFWLLGEPKIAAVQHQKARTLYAEQLGLDHPDTLRSAVGLANSYAALGRHDDARKLYEEALALQKAKLGPDHPDTLLSMHNLANSYNGLGRDQDAFKLREETLALRKARLGLDHPDTLMSMNNLAASYALLGRLQDALRLNEETLELRRARLGPEHPETLGSMNNLALRYAALGRHHDALRLNEETLALKKAKLDPDHPETLRSMSNLANTYAALGRHHDALRLHEETLALRQRKLGHNHPDTLGSMHNLANLYADLGRHEDALRLREATLALRKVKPGPAHVDTLMSMHNLALSYYALGRHAEALRLRQETLARREARLGARHPDTLNSMWGVAASLIKLDRGAEAVSIIDECVQRAAGKVVNPKLIPDVMNLRLRHFEKAKDAAGCRATAALWEKLNRTDADSLYTAARMWAVTAAVRRALDQSEGTAKQADAEAAGAMDWLRKTVTAGYKDVARMEKDDDLDALRERQDFRKLLAELGARTKDDKN